MNRRVCIFCSADGPFATLSHVIPESLGGRHSPTARPGTTCDPCNQYFGQKVESKALQSYPFTIFRLLSSVRSKKGRLHSERIVAGQVQASGRPGNVTLALAEDVAAEHFYPAEESGTFRLLAEVKEAPEVARLLIKIGLEMLAQTDHELALSSRFDSARSFCRRPGRGTEWWFALQTDPQAMIQSMKSRTTECQVEVGEVQGMPYSTLRFPGLRTLVPLEPAAHPSEWPENDPNLRIIKASY
ncbi:HNH endonuclease [Piscinibacter gummiphilus]|uniref:HNH endonuclease n=1 Tax=Piscinibacter gummiphilus TaxID=946333 RepID=UPI0039B860E7